MRVAEDIVKQGMSAGTAFMDALTALIRDNDLKLIVETGSYLGTGTTQAIVRGASPDATIYSIEVNPKHYRQARDNNRGNNVNFLLGLSVPNVMKPVDMTFNVPDFVIVDHQPEDRARLYNREVMYNVPSDMLGFVMLKFDRKPDLVVLDSAGHMGLVEFKYLIKIVDPAHSFYLALDDTNHVKHYETMQIIMNDPDNYQVVFTTEEKFGSAIIKVK